MTVQTNAFLTYDAVGNRENLSEVIKSLSPEETPFSNAIGSTDAKGILYEWQVDALAAADANNAVLEGDVVDGTASTPTTREKNYCQISRRDVVVSSTQEKVKKAGRSSEMGYQVAKRLKELKRDIEAVIVGNQGYNAGATGTARRTRSIESFLATNIDRGATGANAAAATDAATDGTARPFTETMLKSVIQSCYTEGASPNFLSVGPFNKGVVSGFTGRSQARQAIAEDRIQAAAHLYASDFGEIKVMPNRFQRERTALVIDPEYAEIAFLRQPQVKDLARTGDSERKYVVAEYALCIKNEKAHGMMAAIKAWWDESLGGVTAHATDTGSADAYVIAPAPAITAYEAGQAFHFFAVNANTGASTLNVNGLGAKAIQRIGVALSSDDIGAGDLVHVIYDGTQFQLPVIPANLSLAGLAVDTDTLYVDSVNGRIGVGTVVPSAKLHLNGIDSDFSSGPIVRITTNVDAYPLFEGLCYTHNNINFSFDAYYSGGWKSSDPGSNFQFIKNADKFRFRYDSGVPAGAAVSWNTGLSLDVSGNIDISTGNLEFAGVTALPINQLTTLAASTFDQTKDSLLLWDNSASQHRQVKLQDFGLTVIIEAAAQTFSLGDANSLQLSSSASAVTWTVPPVASVAFEIGTVIQLFQSGAGQVTVAPGAGVTLRSPNGTKTSQQYAVACLAKVAADEWALYGDVTV